MAERKRNYGPPIGVRLGAEADRKLEKVAVRLGHKKSVLCRVILEELLGDGDPHVLRQVAPHLVKQRPGKRATKGLRGL